MITNRDISSVELFEQALDEVVESARESGVSDAALAEALRAHAVKLDPAEPK
ncbi:hypothetical protein SAMN04487948_105357 [Halogranum amylolyticum]|uniref:Uncharacterized protein n=1 Tax=Halogranum amylolyticum TaxID=660520 RepID=A0A1H8SXB2_9EURY|nr:hypothetical protein [Halogranum amylolyticum]SEO82823.1 hypothetical protein SAMN04487948_105357 [Halogranum amylolyticum]